MSKNPIPELSRCPLETIVLKAKQLNMGSPKSILALAIDPPNENDISNSVLSLKEVGGLSRLIDGVFVEDDGDITFLGKLMALLPLDVHLTKMVAFGYVFSVLDESIIIAAGLNLKSIFRQESKNKMDAFSKKISWADESGSDCVAILNAYKAWYEKSNDGSFIDQETEKEWCERYNLDMKNLHDLYDLVKEIWERLRPYKIEEVLDVEWTESEKRLAILVCIAGAFFPNFYSRKKVEESDIDKAICGSNPFETVFFRGESNSTYTTYLYENQIAEELVRAGVCSSKDKMKFKFDDNNSKIFVTFSTDSYHLDSDHHPSNRYGVVGKVLPEVYKAVKMRKINGRKFSIRIMK